MMINETTKDKTSDAVSGQNEPVVSVPEKSGYYWFNSGSRFSVDEVVLLHEKINKEIFMYRMFSEYGLHHSLIETKYPNAKWGEMVEKKAH
jgi:hypothetical protein